MAIARLFRNFRRPKNNTKKVKVPVRSTKNGVLYVPYWVSVFSPDKLRRIAKEVIEEAQHGLKED